MSIDSGYLFLASMDVTPDKEDTFNEVYESEHIPFLEKVPGVLSVARFTTEDLTLSIGGELRSIKVEGQPKHTAAYEIESPEVLVSDAWGKAVEMGRWSSEVRPHTTRRRHILLKRTHP